MALGVVNNKAGSMAKDKMLTAKQVALSVRGRKSVAAFMRVHPDSVTRLLSSGLASAVLKWGGHGLEMVFSTMLVARWWGAKTCRRGGCLECRSVLEDCQNAGDHYQEARHGVFGVCPGQVSPDDDCSPQQTFCVPCDWPFAGDKGPALIDTLFSPDAVSKTVSDLFDKRRRDSRGRTEAVTTDGPVHIEAPR